MMSGMDIDVEKVVREYMSTVLHMSLATCIDNKPWVCEVHFGYDEALNLYWRSKPSRRHSKEIEQNKYVSGNIVRQFSLDEQVSGVYFEGIAERVQGVNEQHPAYRALQTRGYINEDAIAEAKTIEDGHVFYKITVTSWHIFGRFDGQSSQKYSLKWPT